jgi:hypothetical protein
MSVLQWSTTAADNDDADAAINWTEGQAPSTVNNSSRAMMAAIAALVKDQGGAITAGGTANAITLTTNMTVTAYAAPLVLAFKASATNTGATTVTVDALASVDLKRTDASALRAGDIVSGGIYLIAYEASAGDFWLLNPSTNEETLGKVRGISTKTDNYTFALTDAGQILEMNSASAKQFLIPANASVAFPLNTYLTGLRYGTGAVTIKGDTGVSLNGVSGGTITISAQYASAVVYKRGTNEWVAPNYTAT